MNARKFVSILTFVLTVLLVSSCATTSKTKEEREGVNQEVFFKSVKGGAFAEVKGLIEEGTDVNAQDNEGWTALMWALEYGHTEVVKLLIEEGADVNAQSNSGETALWAASRYGQHPDIVKLLIEEGADVNAKDKKGFTALMYSSREGNTEIVKLLIEAGADVNAKDKDGFTAFMWAFESKEIRKLLREAGAE